MRTQQVLVGGTRVARKRRSLPCLLGFHQGGIAGGIDDIMFGFCPRCGLRSPYVKFESGAWGITLLKQAIKDKTAYYDE